MDAWSFDACNYYDEGADHAELWNSYSWHIDELNTNMGVKDSISRIPNQPPLPPIYRTSSDESCSSNYMTAGQQIARFSSSATEETVITRALLSVISSSQYSSTSCMHQSYRPTSAFQPYSSSIFPALGSRKNAANQNMVKRVHVMLRNVNLFKSEVKADGLKTGYSQKQNLVSDQKRRERLNTSFHSLWKLLPPGSKKDRASVLCKTMGYMKALSADIRELEEKNRIIEEQVIEVLVTESEETSELRQIDLLVKVRVRCNLMRVVLRVLECIKGMGGVSLLWLDASPSSHEMNLLASLRLPLKGFTWDDRRFKEVIARAALMAVHA